jgi:hypothetical protein
MPGPSSAIPGPTSLARLPIAMASAIAFCRLFVCSFSPVAAKAKRSLRIRSRRSGPAARI